MNILRDPIWQGIAALVTIAGAVLATIAFLVPAFRDRLRLGLHRLTKSSIIRRIIIFLAILIVGIAIGILISPRADVNFVNYPGDFEQSIATLPSTISIYERCYHLGDNTDSNFCPDAPQANPFESKFQVEGTSDSAFIRLTVKDVNPNVSESPIPIYVNGFLVDYLNRHVKEETPDSKEIEIPIPKGIFRIGENNILIFASPHVLSVGTDDFEFRNLVIVFK